MRLSTPSASQPSPASSASQQAQRSARSGAVRRKASNSAPSTAYVNRMSPWYSSTACASPRTARPASRRRKRGAKAAPARCAASICKVKL
ncbi:Uncharacterised protein [Bordetella pertussis]|nr:Uncharacterised protein [Bordetella pertussis]